MENFFFGIKAIFQNLIIVFQDLWLLKVVRGFGIGFFVSTLMHGFIVTGPFIKNKNQDSVESNVSSPDTSSSLLVNNISES